MNLKEHYESYRAAVRKDVSEDVIMTFSKAVQLTNNRTAFSYLVETSQQLREAVLSEDEITYKRGLLGHQEAMVGLLERYTDTLNLKGLDLIEKHGWRAFRFSREPVLLYGDKPQVWIPRYPTQILDVCFDALEMEHLLEHKNSETAQDAYTFKAVHPYQRFVPIKADRVWARADISKACFTTQAFVDDWTGRLFP